MIETDIVNYIKADATLQTLIGYTAGDTKIYPEYAPHNKTYPCILYSVTSESTSEENMLEVQIQFDCIAESYLAATNIKNRVLELLDWQDKIRSLITGIDHIIYWAKKIADGEFLEPDLKVIHKVVDIRFKYNPWSYTILHLDSFPVDSLNKILTLNFQGTIAANMVSGRMHFPAGVTIGKIALHAQDAPAGAAITVDVLKNSIAQARVATLADGANNQETDITLLSVAGTDEFAVKITQVGSTDPGAGLEVKVFYK